MNPFTDTLIQALTTAGASGTRYLGRATAENRPGVSLHSLTVWGLCQDSVCKVVGRMFPRAQKFHTFWGLNGSVTIQASTRNP